MIIREKHRDFDRFVYACYNVDGKRLYLIVPYEGYEGFIAVSEHECTLIDNNINGYKLMISGSGRDIIIHWSVIKDALIDKLIEHERGSVEELRRRLREEHPPEEMAFPE